jgi:hypothetical protein
MLIDANMPSLTSEEVALIQVVPTRRRDGEIDDRSEGVRAACVDIASNV